MASIVATLTHIDDADLASLRADLLRIAVAYGVQVQIQTMTDRPRDDRLAGRTGAVAVQDKDGDR